MNILPEYSLNTHNTTSECNNIHNRIQVLKDIADEVYNRAENGDKTAFDILTKVFKGGSS